MYKYKPSLKQMELRMCKAHTISSPLPKCHWKTWIYIPIMSPATYTRVFRCLFHHLSNQFLYLCTKYKQVESTEFKWTEKKTNAYTWPIFDTPKSAIFSLPFAQIKIFSDFKSWWMTFFICKYSRPSKMSMKYLITSWKRG